MPFPGFKRLVHRAITHFSSMEFIPAYENQLISADHGQFWRSVVEKNCNFFHLFQFQARGCKIRTRWAMMIIFYSCDTPRVIFLPWDHLKKGGRKGVRSLSFGWLSNIKNWWKKHTVTTWLSWEQISAPLSAPLFSNDPMVNIWHMGYHWIKKLSS